MFTNIAPSADKLKRYVSSFTISIKKGLYPVKYMAFPNLGTCLSFFNHTTFSVQSNEITFGKDETNCAQIILLGRLTSPTLVTYNEPLDEISINFTPIGINYFFGSPFSRLAGKLHQSLKEPKWNKFASALFSELPEKRIAMLEAFLLSNLDEKRVEKMDRFFSSIQAVHMLTVNELANLSCMSERNFLRQFRKYFGCSPSTYKRIVRFRNTLDMLNIEDTNTHLKFSLVNPYYDSSHFRKEFVKFTGCTPKKFVSSSFLPGNGNSVFKLL